MGKCKSAKSGAWCFQCYDGLKGRAFHAGHYGHRPPPPTPFYGGVKMLKAPGGEKAVQAHVESLAVTAFGKKHPQLLEYLSLTVYEGGEKRQTSTLTIFVEDGFVKLCLNDRDAARTGWVAETTLEEAMKTLEGKLVSGQVEWRKSWSGSAGGKKKGG